MAHHSTPHPTWRHGAPLRSPEHSPERNPGRLDSSCGDSKLDLTRPQHDGPLLLSSRRGTRTRGHPREEQENNQANSMDCNDATGTLCACRTYAGMFYLPLVLSCSRRGPAHAPVRAVRLRGAPAEQHGARLAGARNKHGEVLYRRRARGLAVCNVM